MNELYIAIRHALQDMAFWHIRHIDLWNQNVSFIESDEPWDRPAVFVEFGGITWETFKGKCIEQKGKGTFTLHIVTDWAGSAADEGPGMEGALRLNDMVCDIDRAMCRLFGESFRNINLLESHPNHNHEDIIETVEVFSVTYGRKV